MKNPSATRKAVEAAIQKIGPQTATAIIANAEKQQAAQPE
jgi:DNA uptake protein ComE-like DNA-binding protein